MTNLFTGAGTGGATKTIVKQLGQAFSSYTFTDISSGFFEKAQEVFRDYRDCMVFKTLDIEKDPVSQGFVEHSYDMILCSLVLHATRDLDATMKNVRRLLKPGGYVAMLELTNLRPIRVGFCMGGLPGWWLGSAEDGREFCPCVTANKWNTILRKTGFAGIDAITPDVDTEPWPVSIIVAHATDDRMDLLRRPLSAPAPVPVSQELIILGGSSLPTAVLGDDLEELLGSWYGSIHRVDTLEDFIQKGFPPMCSVMSITELDEPIFRDMTQERLDALKTLFDQSRNVLWITRGCKSDDPYLNMTLGFGRTAQVEMPQLRLQFLDLDALSNLDARILAETLLRLQFTESWDEKGIQNKVLWSTEPELSLQQGRLLVPRVVSSKARNDRYNSTRRPINKEMAPGNDIITIEVSGNACHLKEAAGLEIYPNFSGVECVTIQVSHSLLRSIKVMSAGTFFVMLGTIIETGTRVLALSESQSSRIKVPKAWTAPCENSIGRESHRLLSFATELVAQSILAEIPFKGTLLVHEPPPMLSFALATQASKSGINMVFTTTNEEFQGSPAVYIHPQTLARYLRTTLPVDVSLFVDFSRLSETDSIAAAMRKWLPSRCHIMSGTNIFSSDALPRSVDLTNFIPGLLSEASKLYQAPSSEGQAGDVDVLSLHNLPSTLSTLILDTVVDWSTSATVTVKVEPVDRQVAFKKDKTYLLFGLSGQLGRSLSQWMVSRGARYIVLTSRRPEVDDRWMDKMATLGATIQIFPK